LEKLLGILSAEGASSPRRRESVPKATLLTISPFRFLFKVKIAALQAVMAIKEDYLFRRAYSKYEGSMGWEKKRFKTYVSPQDCNLLVFLVLR
jgi:hypothetical protein